MYDLPTGTELRNKIHHIDEMHDAYFDGNIQRKINTVVVDYGLYGIKDDLISGIKESIDFVIRNETQKCKGDQLNITLGFLGGYVDQFNPNDEFLGRLDVLAFARSTGDTEVTITLHERAKKMHKYYNLFANASKQIHDLPNGISYQLLGINAEKDEADIHVLYKTSSFVSKVLFDAGYDVVEPTENNDDPLRFTINL